MRSALAVSSRGDISQIGIAQGGRTRVLFSPGGNQSVPGAPGTFYSALWFSSDTQAMEMKVVGTTITYTANPAFGMVQRDRNPNATIFDARDMQTAALRFKDLASTRFVDFLYDSAVGLPGMTLFSDSNGNAHRYIMLANGTGFSAPTPYTFAVMSGVLKDFESGNSSIRDGATVIRVGAGDQGVATMDALGVKNYSTDEPYMGAFLRPALAPTVGGIRLRNNTGAVVEITAGAAGALTAALV